MLDDGETDWIASGLHYVNRMDYVLTEIPLEGGVDMDVVDDDQEPVEGGLAHGDYELTEGSGSRNLGRGQSGRYVGQTAYRDRLRLRVLVRNALFLMLPVAYIRPVCSRGTCLPVLLSMVAKPLRHSMAFAA